MPEVRQELLTTLKDRFIPLGVLDEFQSAGVFVNWWQQIRYDLKTIVSTGWHHTLIPDSYLIAAFFQEEADEIETLEATLSETQSELGEAVEAGQEIAAYEPEEGESITATVIKKVLKKLHDLATHELERYLNAAKRQLIRSVENFWDKYAVSSRALESERAETHATLDGFLAGLGYLK